MVALIFGIVNAVLKPVIKTVGCAFYLLTLGLVGLVVNALLFLLVSALSGAAHLPFAVHGFVAAFLGAIVMAVVGFRAAPDHSRTGTTRPEPAPTVPAQPTGDRASSRAVSES